jgi:hypothetical protein
MSRSFRTWTETFVVDKGLKETVRRSRDLNEFTGLTEIALNPPLLTSLCFNIIKFLFDDTSEVLFSHS